MLEWLIAAQAAATSTPTPSGFKAEELRDLCGAAENYERTADGALIVAPDGSPFLRKTKVLQFLWRSHPVSDAARDENNDGSVAWRESARAIAYLDACQKGDPLVKACVRDKDAENLFELRRVMSEFRTYASEGKAFSKPGKPGAVVFWSLQPMAESQPTNTDDFANRPGDQRVLSDALVDGAAFEVLSADRRIALSCRGTDATASNEGQSGKTGGADPSPWTRAGRLRASPDNVFESLTKENKKTIKGASVNYEDRAGGSSKLAADITAGMAFTQSLEGGGAFVIVPFIEAEASNLSGKTANDPDRIGAGLGVSLFAVSGPLGIPWRLSGYGEYLTDTGFEASMGYFKLLLQPTPAIPCFNAYRSVFGLPVQMYCEADLRADVARIWDDGAAPAFVKLGEDYARLGYRTALTFRGRPVDNLDWVSLATSYQNLHDVLDNGNDLERFDAILKLAPSELQLFQQDAVLSIDVAYSNGNADVTLEEQEKVTIGLSLTY